MAQIVKNLPEMQETCVQSLGWEDPLEKGMATHPSTLAWIIPWTEELGVAKSRTRLSDSLVRTHTHTHTHTHARARMRVHAFNSSKVEVVGRIPELK